MKGKFLFNLILKGNSIKSSIIKSSISIFIFIILALSISLSYYVKEAYYNTISDNLSNQIVSAVEEYENSISNISLETSILLDLENFSGRTGSQIQIINLDGKVLLDSRGVVHNKPIDSSDFKTAISGGLGEWIGRVFYSKHRVISVAHPIRVYNQIVGVVRFIVSLESANQNIIKIMFTFVLAAFVALLFYIIIIGIVTNRIVEPIKSLISVANKMALGELSVRCEDLPKNEIGVLGGTLNYMADEISKKDELKNDFISTVSHELRTPLTSIKGWAITLQYEKSNNPGILDGLKIIESETDRLSSMVEELLDFSKFISHKVTLKFEEVSLEDIYNYIFNYIKPREDREGFKFIHEDEFQNIKLMVDFNRLKQVIVNVLDNSIKFLKEDGKIEIKYLIKKDEKLLLIEILDNGIGIPKDEISKVKEKFFKGKTSKSKNGLGLSISDEIMKLHGGGLEVDSVYGEWTKVTLRLPIT